MIKFTHSSGRAADNSGRSPDSPDKIDSCPVKICYLSGCTYSIVISSPGVVLISLLQDNYEISQKKSEAEKLFDTLSAMSKDEIAKVFDDGLVLRNSQISSTEDSCLPSVKLTGMPLF